MRHGKKINHLGRKKAHRDAMLSNLAVSLIKHKRIHTTVAKAKALRSWVEPLITKAKEDTTHSRRTVFVYLQDKEAVTLLFREISQKIADRPGGYTRILKTGNRLGDSADMCYMELVDYNENLLKASEEKKQKSGRRRRGAKKDNVKKENVQHDLPLIPKEEVVANEISANEIISEPENIAEENIISDTETESTENIENTSEEKEEDKQ